MIFTIIFKGFGELFKSRFMGKLLLDILKLPFRILVFLFPTLGNLFNWKKGYGSGIYGTATFATEREVGKMLDPKNDEGLPIDASRAKMSLDDCTKHILLCGSSGIGKTTKLLYPILLTAKPNASYLVTDVSGEAFNDTSGYLKRMGFEVKRINLMDNTASHQYNPVAQCRTATDYDKLTELLVTSANQNDRNGGFWQDSAKMVLSTLLKTLANHPDKNYHNLHNLRYLVNQLSIDKASLNQFISSYADQETFDDFRAIISQDPKLLADVMSTAKVSLKALGDPLLREISAGSQIDFQGLRKKPTVLFVSYNVNEIGYLRFFLSIFWTQAIGSFFNIDLGKKDFLPVYGLLDEFQNLSRIPNFENAITTLRKYKVSLFLMLQGLDGLKQYKDAADIILGNCKTKLFSSGLQHKDSELISKILGNTTVRYASPNSGHLSSEDRLRDVREMQRPLLTPDEVRQIPEDRCVMIHGSKKPAMLQLKAYYDEPNLKQLTAIPAVTTDFTMGRTPVGYIHLNTPSP